MSALAAKGGAILSVSPTRLPAALMLSTQGHQEHSRRVKLQSKLTESKRQRLWNQTITAKISMQYQLLRSLQLPYETLLQCSQSGRATSKQEGVAAAIYFKNLFGKDFLRQPQNKLGINGALDYGYTILYSAFAREIVSKGLSNSLPLFHTGRGNTFGLASDLMEPYRPYVDRIVWHLTQKEQEVTPHSSTEKRV